MSPKAECQTCGFVIQSDSLADLRLGEVRHHRESEHQGVTYWCNSFFITENEGKTFVAVDYFRDGILVLTKRKEDLQPELQLNR